MIERAQQAGVMKFFLPNIDTASVDAMQLLSDQYPAVCYPMMGLHPCSVNEKWEEEISGIEQWITNDRFQWYGIGETGLDYYWDKTFIDRQKENFLVHINWAKQFRLPLIIHSRDAIDDCISLVSQHKTDDLGGIFHCFSGTLEQARQIIDLGFYLGIGGVVTFKNSGLDKVMEETDLDQVVLETDSPYLAPVPYRGKRNESSYLQHVVKKLSEIKKIPKEEVATITTANALELFKIFA